MSTIRVYAKGRLSPSTLRELRSVTDVSAATLVQAANANQPLMEFELFARDHDEIAARIRKLLTNVPADHLQLEHCVTDPETREERCHQRTFEVLLNILDRSDQIARDLDQADEDS